MVPPPNALALYIVRASWGNCNPARARSKDRNARVTFCDCPDRQAGHGGGVIYPRYRMVQSSRLEQLAVVCFQLVGACSNSKSSRLESAKQTPRIARDADALRIVSSRLEMDFRETLIAVLAPVRNSSVVCFEGVTSISVCESEPVRNADGKREIESFFVAGKLGSVRRRSIPTAS